MFKVLYRFHKGFNNRLFIFITGLISKLHLKGNSVIIGTHPKFVGIPNVFVHQKGKCKIGSYFSCNSGTKANPIGRNTKTYLRVGSGARLTIGNHVGISNVAIVCQKQIEIGNNVKIGGNVVIYDTDFHSLSYEDRLSKIEKTANIITKPVSICDNVFIGAHSIILKGVTIHDNSIIGAGSVVTKNIPANEIWAGNPARFIKSISV